MLRIFKLLVFAILLALILTLFFLDSGQEKEIEQIDTLSLEQKIGQLFLIGFEGKTLTPGVKDLIETVHPGGIILFSRNIDNADQLEKLIKDLSDLSLKDSGLPLFVAIDQEGGVVRRLKWLQDETSQTEIQSSEQAYQIGLERGRGLKALGINLNLAPVLDITQAGDFLHNRSFQENPEKTGQLAKSLISGQKEAGILSTMKHFPGYGGIAFNPEAIELPILPKIPEISQFQKAFEAQPELIMTANVIYLEINESLPFTLSRKGVQLLKEKIKGNYLIISDDLSGKALKEKFALKDIVTLATKAGLDILLIAGWNQHKDPFDAFDALLGAVKNGDIPEERINESLLKIIQLKQNL